MSITLENQEDLAYYVRIDIIFCFITGILFSIGIIANVWVIQRIIRSLVCGFGGHDMRPRHIFVYVGALAATDLSLLLNCPFLIHDVANMRWNFGTFLCKCMYGNECLNKLLSGFLLAALSFDQLITVRKILNPSWRTVSAAWKMTGSLIFTAFILLIPLFLYTRVITLIDEQIDETINITTPAIEKCVFAPPPDMIYLANAFILSIFLFGFCLPTLCIAISYGTILYRFAVTGSQQIAQSANRSRWRTRRMITWYILSLIGIYLSCWTPYWVAAVRVGLAPQYYHDSQHYNLAITYALLYIHLLPYLNAVLNPFAYGCVLSIQCSRRLEKREKVPQKRIPIRNDMTTISLGETWSMESRSSTRIERHKRPKSKNLSIELSQLARE